MNAKVVYGFLSGALFALGLVVSGMTQPPKVLGFLNITGIGSGTWDPSLAFVMGGALLVTSLAFWLTPREGKSPWVEKGFSLPTRTDIDFSLVFGGVLFGIGWGLAGYCPGPALASVLVGGSDALYFTLAMLLGMWAVKFFRR